MEVGVLRGHRHGSAGWKGVILSMSVVDYGYFRRDSGHASNYAWVAAKTFFDDGTKIRQMFDFIEQDGIICVGERGG